MNTEIIKHENRILAIIVDTSEIEDKLKFFSPENFPLQVGIHNRKKDDYLRAHEHIPFEKLERLDVQEIFYVERGKIRVGLYDRDKKILDRVITEKELIILNSGHDVEFLEDTRMIEIKQGPYRGNKEEKRYLK